MSLVLVLSGEEHVFTISRPSSMVYVTPDFIKENRMHITYMLGFVYVTFKRVNIIAI
jgi:hypothetical protein